MYLCNHFLTKVFLTNFDHFGVYHLCEIPDSLWRQSDSAAFFFDGEKEEIHFSLEIKEEGCMFAQRSYFFVTTPDPNFDLEAFFKQKTGGKYIPSPPEEPMPERWQKPFSEWRYISYRNLEISRYYHVFGDLSSLSYTMPYTDLHGDDDDNMVSIIKEILQESTAPSSDGKLRAGTHTYDPFDRINSLYLKEIDCELTFQRHLSVDEIYEYDSFFSGILAEAFDSF